MTNNYTEQIASILSGKIEIHNVSEEVIQIMLEEHPYSPYGHLVNYLKAKSQNRDDANQLLAKLATYSPDRAWLQQVLNTTFKDIQTHESTDHAIPSEAKDPNLDKVLFEFDFNHPIVHETAKDSSKQEEELSVSIDDEEHEEINELDQTEYSEEKPIAEVKEEGSYVSWLSSFKSEESKSTSEKKVETTTPIERRTEIKPPVEEKTTRKDNDLFGGIITETLAELLANQGQTEKAIGMYERLSLIFPNKSAFFAAKIEQLKSNIS